MIEIKFPLAAVEPLFTVLSKIKPLEHSRLEMKAVALLKQSLYFELERQMQDELDQAEQEFSFKRLFEEERIRRGAARTK